MMRIAIGLVFWLLALPAFAAEVDAVASFSILGDMVSRVGGDRVAVTTIVGPNADTHVHEPKPSDAAAVAQADIFFINGLGFEGWMDRLVQSTDYRGSLVVVSEGVVSHPMREPDGDQDAGQDELDPHAWQSLSNGVLYIQNIAAGLCAVDAAGCQVYAANASAYISELKALDANVKHQIAAIPVERRKVITTHDAFGYFGEAYGVAFLAAEGISTEAEPSAADVAKLINQIRTEGVTAIFIENMSDSRLMEQISAETHTELGGELYADALSAPDGPAATYLDMFRYNIKLLVSAMTSN